ncbi:hypothetical protein HZC09_04390 [Candidatus Micrarchaeota archaeon]|nr:hypothetical protein [Candidatus Micrarchaeota archaeon]
MRYEEAKRRLANEALKDAENRSETPRIIKEHLVNAGYGSKKSSQALPRIWKQLAEAVVTKEQEMILYTNAKLPSLKLLLQKGIAQRLGRMRWAVPRSYTQ